MDGLRSFTEVDNHSAVDVGGLRRGTKSICVQKKKQQFSEPFPEAVIREGADELTLRAEEVGSLRTFIDAKHIQLESWHAVCQAICKGIEEKQCEGVVLTL